MQQSHFAKPLSAPSTARQFLQAGAVLGAFAVLVSVACSGRTRLHDPGASGAGGASSAGQGGDSSGGSDEHEGGASGTGEACDIADAESCSDQERCCPEPSGNACVPITWRNCTGCNEACDLLVSNACVDRTCVCGDEPACSGATPYCVLGECVQCLGDAECSGVAGRGQCVAGTCVECDPADSVACSGTRRACSDEGECVPCSEEQACPGSLYCDPDSGHCKACVEHAQCPDELKPICVEYTEMLSDCQPCTSDAQCADRDPERGQCVSGECVACDPADDGGCDADEECLPGGDAYECRGCLNDTDCDDLETPLCSTETHTCVPCNDPSIDAPHAHCDGEGAWACITTGEHEGQCGACDPASHAGCYPQAPFCDVDAACKECLGPGDCPDGFECSPNDECIGCTSDTDCASSPNGTQCVDVTGGKACRTCDPNDHAGCPPLQKCWDGFICGSP